MKLKQERQQWEFKNISPGRIALIRDGEIVASILGTDTYGYATYARTYGGHVGDIGEGTVSFHAAVWRAMYVALWDTDRELAIGSGPRI